MPSRIWIAAICIVVAGLPYVAPASFAAWPPAPSSARPLVLLVTSDVSSDRWVLQWRLSGGYWQDASGALAETDLERAWWVDGPGGGSLLVTYGEGGFAGWTFDAFAKAWGRAALPGQLADRRFAGRIESRIASECAISRNGAYVAFVSDRGLARVDVRSGREDLLLKRAQLPGEVHGLTLSRDGARLAFTTTGKHRYHCSDDEAYEELWVLDVRVRSARHLGRGARPAWNADGTCLLALDGPRTGGHALVEYDVGVGRRRVLRTAAIAAYQSVAFSSEGNRIAVWGAYGPRAREEHGPFFSTPRGQVLEVLPRSERAPATGPARLVW